MHTSSANSQNSQQPQPTTQTKKQQVSFGVQSLQTEIVATELSRNALARERYEFLLRVTFGITIILFLSVAANIYLGARPVEYRYFVTNPNGAIQEIEVLSRPIQSEQQVLNWVTQIISSTYSLSFANYQQQLHELESKFTASGWRGLQLELENSGFITSLLNNQLVTSAVPRGAPIVVAQGLVGNVYGWRLQLPLLVTYKSASVNRNQELLVEVTVVRRPAHEDPIGLGIEKIIAN